MGPRTRRFVAMIGVVIFLAAYVWAALWVGDRIPNDQPLWKVLYFAVVGTAWGVPLWPLFAWAEGGRRR